MCGICGIWNLDGAPVDNAALDVMRDELRRRGPDDEGRYVSGPVGLGHSRLSIIDLASGHQPLTNEDGSIWVTYNGEVYNFPELRTELEMKGHTFRTRTDTEAIVHLYEEMGPRCVDKLRGMFAFAIWDSRRQQMVLARDRLGEKPLYYLHDGQRFCFASELKAFRVLDWFEPRLNLEGLEAYLTLDCIPAPLSIYEGVHKLPPAHILVCSQGELKIERYWRPATSLHANGRAGKIIDYAEELRSLLQEAVRLRLVSDVPLGVLLSGGIDSTAIVATMAQVRNQTIQTFSIGSPDSEFNELPYARKVAEHFGTTHHEYVVEPDVVAVLPDLLDAYDEPFADSSAIPMYYVSRMARQSVKVVLSGDGGDELFAGYPWYQSESRYGGNGGAFKEMRRMFAVVGYPFWPDDWRGKGRLELWRQPSAAWWYAATRNRFPPYERRALLSPEMKASLAAISPVDVVARAAAEAEEADSVGMMQYADLLAYLPEDLLVKVDRAAMWHSLEVRPPFLDHKLVEFALGIPTELKLSVGDSKRILKQIIASQVPFEVTNRPKKGFGIPLRRWLRKELYPFARDVLLDGRTTNRGFFQKTYLTHLLEGHRLGKTDPTVSTHRIWNLLYLELWCREFLDKNPTRAVFGNDR